MGQHDRQSPAKAAGNLAWAINKIRDVFLTHDGINTPVSRAEWELVKAWWNIAQRYSREMETLSNLLYSQLNSCPSPQFLPYRGREHPRWVCRTCRGVKKNGKPCSARRHGGTAYCWQHQSQAQAGQLSEIETLITQLAGQLPGANGGGANG
jgi:hypothetical protein